MFDSLTRNTLAAISGTAAALALAACGGAEEFLAPVAFATAGKSPAPSIATQPQPLAIREGGPAMFQVAADGAEPLTYQWRRNGVAITGATGRAFSVAAATVADSGAQYSAEVANKYGKTTSTTATLFVAPQSEAYPWE